MLSQFYKFVYIIINDFMLLWTTTFLSDKLNLSLHHQYQKDNPGFQLLFGDNFPYPRGLYVWSKADIVTRN